MPRMRKDSELNAVTAWIQQKLQSSSDFVERAMENQTSTFRLFFLTSTCDERLIENRIIQPYYAFSEEAAYIDYLLSHSTSQLNPSKETALLSLLSGSVLIQCGDEVLTLKTTKTVLDQPVTATTERVVIGPKSGLSENLQTNLNIMRSTYTSANLHIDIIKNKVSVMYDTQFADRKLAASIVKKLNQHSYYRHQTQHYLEDILNDGKKELFPKMNFTERKDRLSMSLQEGKILIFLDGSPFAFILPASFFDMMHSMADFYYPYWISFFIQVLRYSGMLVTLVLPSLYVAITSYNPELFRIELTLSIAGTRLGVPYPSFIEVLLMLSMMELLTEASVRLPEAIGPTATTVGGLILGEAATQAGLVSNIMIIVVAAVAISNYAIPNIKLAFAFRVTKYFILLLTILTGLIGLMVGLLGVLAYLCHQESFGDPYFRLFPREKPLLMPK